MAKTLYDKLWESHVVHVRDDETTILYIDRHLTHEVTTPQAYEGLENAGRGVRRRDKTIAVPDHNVPTKNRDVIHDEMSRIQLETLYANCEKFGVELLPLNDARQGIVHVIGPEQGWIYPGQTVVCGDSHSATHGALGCLAFGIGTSDVEHVLATQCMVMRKAKNMRVHFEGTPAPGITAKDMTLAVIGKIGTAGGTGHVIEYTGEAVRALSLEGRMTMCNMAIEGGARSGIVAPDETTFRYVMGRPRAPKGAAWEAAIAYWKSLKSDEGAVFDAEVVIDASAIEPLVTWGTSPEDVVPVTGCVPDPDGFEDENKRNSAKRALSYMGLAPGTQMTDVKVDRIFIGSCTNSRIEDLRAAAELVRGKKKADWVTALVVPGSGLIKYQAEEEGLDELFKAAGFEWREAGCSMCLGMNEDIAGPGERVASTSNRNFEGRQGPGARTHLMSPAMAALAGINGYISDVREVN